MTECVEWMETRAVCAANRKAAFDEFAVAPGVCYWHACGSRRTEVSEREHSSGVRTDARRNGGFHQPNVDPGRIHEAISQM